MSRPLVAAVCALTTVTGLWGSALAAHAGPATQPHTKVASPAAVKAPSKSHPQAPAKAAPTPRAFVSRMTASSTPIVDAAGRTWAPRGTGFGGWKRNSSLVGSPIARTTHDALYQRVGYQMAFYRLDVPAAATYRVRMLFAEPVWKDAGKRVFDVVAEGRVVAAKVDVAKAVGRAAAYDITVPVAVKDGRLDLTFVASADTPILAGVEVTSMTAVRPAPAKAATPLVPVAPSSFYYDDISRAPLAANSSALAANLAAQVKNHWGGVAAFNAFTYNASVAYASPQTPRVRVAFDNCQRKNYLPDGLFNGARHFVDVPIPATAVPAGGTDGELTVYDRASDTAWEFWQARKRPGGEWSACWGGRIDKVSTNPGIFAKPFGVSASGLLMAPGVISLEDFRRGRIDHAMYLAIIAPAMWNQVSWPANRSDGFSRDANALAQGQRLRLDPTLDIGSLGLTPVGDMIARAAQKHGFIVADTAGAVSVVTESGSAVRGARGGNPWNELLAGPAYEAMRNFPWDKVQVLPRDYGKPQNARSAR